jgi:hypothetical protein
MTAVLTFGISTLLYEILRQCPMPDILCLFEQAKESEFDLWMARISVLLTWAWTEGLA